MSLIKKRNHWFSTQQLSDWLFLTQEVYFFEGNRCNIWLVKGPKRDVIIDTGLGVCNLKEYLDTSGFLRKDEDCFVICTHGHFDHSGGAHHFQSVFIHERDQSGLKNGRQTETLNYVKSNHFFQMPYKGFSTYSYRVPPTECSTLTHGQLIDIGNGESLEIIHIPGHTKGSIGVYYEAKSALFVGDFVYECGRGENLIDWLPSSSVAEYATSCERIMSWLSNNKSITLYPGHFEILSSDRAMELLQQYLSAKNTQCSRCGSQCMKCCTFSYFLLDCCFRCCPC